MAPPATSLSENRPNPTKMDKFSMITMLLQVVVTLRHRNEDLTLRSFRPTHSGSKTGEYPDLEMTLTTLEAFNALLTPNGGVVAARCREEVPLFIPKDGCNDDSAHNPDTQKYIIPSHIVVMANPDKKTNAVDPMNFNESNPLNIRFVTDGVDLWPKIKKSEVDDCDPLGCIARGESVSLASHARTVCSYLNDFKATPPASEKDPKSEDQMGYSRKFFNYLISFCWEKLHRRFTSWPGLGFIYNLESTWLKLEGSDAIHEYSRWESFNVPHTGDNSLSRFLKNHRFILPLLNALLVRGGSFETGSFDSLIQAIMAESPALFTKNTAKDFHKLVFGTFIMLSVELHEFKTRCRNWIHLDAKARHIAMLSFRRIGLYTRLLLSILASTSFRHYITFIVECGVESLVPLFNDRFSYNAKWKLHQAVLAVGNSVVSPVKAETTNVLDPGDEDSAADLEIPWPNGEDLGELLRWIRAFVLEFIGKRHLEQKCIKMHSYSPKSSVEIAVMTTDLVHYSMPEWKEFKALIDGALETCPGRPAKYSSDFVIAGLLDEISKNKGGYRKSAFYIDIFKKLIDYERRGVPSKGKLSVPLAVHCEAALVALPEFPEALKESTDNPAKLHSSMISISKLCCPACWELISLLRDIRLAKATGGSPKLAIHGSHPRIHPVVLPPWISDPICVEMNSKFLGYLGTELVQLMAIHDAKQVVSRSRNISCCQQLSRTSTFNSTWPSPASSNNEGEFEEDYYSGSAGNPPWMRETTIHKCALF